MHERMKLENVGDGALSDLFDEATVKIMRDLLDPTKIGDAERTLTLTVRFKRKDEDPTAPIEVLCGSAVKLAKRKQRQSFAAITHDGKLVQHLAAQPALPLAPAASEEAKEEEEGSPEADEPQLRVMEGTKRGDS